MKLSIVILCWNDLHVIAECLESIYSNTHVVDFEVIVADNGSTDGSVECIHKNFPEVQVIENRTNLRFARGNNRGIFASNGDYILILNPDTILQDGALDRWVEFADRHPEAGGFACRVVNSDGSYQGCARPFPTVRGEWLSACCLRFLGYVCERFVADRYIRWRGETERTVDWQAGCCLMVRAWLLKKLGGFDEQFEYYYEDIDLCHRIWDAGWSILYTPEVEITHLKGQSTKRYRLAFEIDKYRNRYRYYYKYFGRKGVRRCRRATLVWLWVRRIGYGLLRFVQRSESLGCRLTVYRVAAEWNSGVNPVEFVTNGREPEVGQEVATRVPGQEGSSSF